MMNKKNYVEIHGITIINYNYIYIDMSKKTDQGRYCIYIESKNSYIEFECTPETKPF